jgi:phosphoribosylamine--glycine ligase
MGAYAPLPWAPAGLANEVTKTVIAPAIARMRRRGTPYSGLLYAGLALTTKGIRVVEFNARFGDPETQVVLDRLATPLAALLHAAATGDLASAPPLRWHDGAAVTVVIAAAGYPENPVKGEKIQEPEDPERIVVTPSASAEPPHQSASSGIPVHPAAEPPSPRPAPPGVPVHPPSGPAHAYLLHAGTALDSGGNLVSAGGRVLNVVGTGPDIDAARAAAYAYAGMIRMHGGWYRHDIAKNATGTERC